MSAKLDPYRILQVRPDAGQEEIKVAFRRLARRYHPDRANDEISNARMIEVNQAWELLGDPVRRAAYDRAHGILPRAARQAPAQPAAGDAGAAETDPPEEADIRDRPGDGVSGGGATDGARPGPGATVGAEGAVPPPPRPGGRPNGATLPFGRYEGWTLAEIARVEPEYLEWLVRMPIGWQYRNEIGALLAARPGAAPQSPGRSAPPRRRGFLGR